MSASRIFKIFKMAISLKSHAELMTHGHQGSQITHSARLQEGCSGTWVSSLAKQKEEREPYQSTAELEVEKSSVQGGMVIPKGPSISQSPVTLSE